MSASVTKPAEIIACKRVGLGLAVRCGCREEFAAEDGTAAVS
jgi:hypothetical protein